MQIIELRTSQFGAKSLSVIWEHVSLTEFVQRQLSSIKVYCFLYIQCVVLNTTAVDVMLISFPKRRWTDERDMKLQGRKWKHKGTRWPASFASCWLCLAYACVKGPQNRSPSFNLRAILFHFYTELNIYRMNFPSFEIGSNHRPIEIFKAAFES